MSVNYGLILRALDLAYPREALAPARVDFVRDENGLPQGRGAGHGISIILRSLDWGTEREVYLGRPMSERECLAAPQRRAAGGWEWGTGGQISDRFDAAIQELREAPPFYVP